MQLIDKISTPDDLKLLSVNELPQVAREIRELIIDTVEKNGGHLSSNLGVVDLVIALHYVFDTPNDKIVFDVGHQCYAHKILTQRKHLFSTLRKNNGLSGFPKMQESIYDCANTGHASTSLSIACGLARANDDNHQIITLIGDGALTGGLAYEALNDFAVLDKKQIVIVNDNEMSIDKNVGLIANYLNQIKKDKSALAPFKTLNIDYIGTVDGHDFDALIEALNKAKSAQRSVIVHVCTKKGKGYTVAEDLPEKYHGYTPSKQNGITFSQALGSSLSDLADRDNDIFAITAAMASGTGLDIFAKNHQDKFVDTGIAEAHALCMASGLAIGGKKPYVAIYSTFLQRAYDQLIHDICIPNLPVRICIDRCGIVAQDGETHQGIYDISFMRQLPNLVIACPKDIEELQQMIEFSDNINYPFAIRYPKAENLAYYTVHEPIQLGKWEYVCNNQSDIDIIATDAVCVNEAIKTADILSKEGILVNVINARFIKPFDNEMLDNISDHKIFTLENGVETGGFGEGIVNYYAKKSKNTDITVFAFDEKIYPIGDVDFILDQCNLSARKLAERIKKLL